MWLAIALAVAAPQESAAPAPPDVLFSLRCEGLPAFFVDEKDAAFLNALQLVDDRLRDLPGEVPDFDVPPPALDMALRLLQGPMTLAVGLNPEPLPAMPVPVVAELRSTRGAAGTARGFLEELADLMNQAGAGVEPPANGGAWVLPAPVPAWMNAEGGDFVARLGLEQGFDPALPNGLLPAGARTALRGRLDYGRMLDFMLEMAEQQGGSAEMEAVFGMLSESGFDALAYEFAIGSDAERQYMVVRMPGFAETMRAQNVVPEAGLGESILRAIPADATWAMAAAFDLEGLLDMYQRMFQGLGVDVVAELDKALGMSVREDLLAPIGQRMAVYASDTTGGGGTLSSVLVLELKDAERFHATWSRLEDLVASLHEETKGYVRLAHHEAGGLQRWTLTFPGLPIPLEITLADRDGYLVAGLTPQAVEAALAQLAAPERSLLDNPGFRAQRGAAGKQLTSLQWIDTPRLFRDGYGTVSLVGSMLANAVRSPRDASREPGLVVPTYATLARDAKPILALGYVDGDDFVSECRADRSHLVNLAGVAGFVQNSPLLPLVGAMAAGIVAERQQQMESGMVWDDYEGSEYQEVDQELAALYEALYAYSANNDGHFPVSLMTLVIPDENGAVYLDGGEDALTDPWGAPYGYDAPATEDDYPYVYSRTLESEDEMDFEEWEEVEDVVIPEEDVHLEPAPVEDER
ncbi:MAG: type II secretion system protein GspG [Planctomycetes bacterium]|nr:type II secretion system protein GspG [Planctomycetota bacterium]